MALNNPELQSGDIGRDYAEEIKDIVKEATSDGVIFTDVDVRRVVQEAYAEMRDQAARRLYGSGCAEEQKR